jgi:hypothetical protein
MRLAKMRSEKNFYKTMRELSDLGISVISRHLIRKGRVRWSYMNKVDWAHLEF